MATIDTAYYVPTFYGLCATFGISCTITVSCVVSFEFFRTRKTMQCLFAPRTRLAGNNAAPPLSHKPFGWLKGTFHLDESYFINHVGLDATMYLRYLRMASQFLMVQAILVCPVLLIVHWNASMIPSDSTYTFQSNATLYRLSISNVPDESPVLWVHVVFTFIISLSWLWLLFVNYWHHLLLLQDARRSRTVLLTNVPHHLRNAEQLRQHFSSEIGAVETVYLLSQAGINQLHLHLDRRELYIDRLERQLIRWYRHPQTQEPTEDLVTIIKKIDHVDTEIEQLREFNHFSSRYHTPTGTAFVTFKSIESAQICAKMSWKPGVFQTQIAPEPRDLLWKGLLRHGRRDKLMGRLRQWVVFIAVWSLTIFWLFPVSFILSLTSMESLSQHFRFLNYFMDTSDVVRSFIQNILPMLLVTLFMSVLPWILLAISKQQDFVSYSQLEDVVLGRYYRFAVFNVLIVFLLGTSFLSTMLDALYEPAKMIHLLGKFLPQGANFFLNYILFNSATHAMELVQLGSQLFGHIYYRITAKTPRELAKHTKPWSFPYYYYYPNHILVFVIAVTYAVIQPLILLFALFYFAIAVICYRHQFAYAYVRSYESNGRLYRRMAGYTSDGLLIFQLTMTGLLYLKAALSAATAILPLTLFTIWAKVQLNRQFSRRCYRIQCQEQQQKINDGVWKVAYIKAWWRHGRYGPQHFPQYQPHSMPSSPTSSTSTDKHALITGPMQVYPDDAPRDDDVYTYPPLVTPLERRLWLPRNVCRHRYNLDDCVSLSLDELRRPLDPPNA